MRSAQLAHLIANPSARRCSPQPTMLLLAELRERVGIDGFLSHDEFQRLHHFGLVRGEILLRLEPEAVLVVGELPERALGTVDAQGGGASEAELRRAKHLSGLA